MYPNGQPLVRPINSYMLPIAPQMQQPMPGPSQQQINSFKFLFNSSTPQQRQQMLQNAHPAFVQAVAGQPINAPVQNQTPGLGWRDQLTNDVIGMGKGIWNGANNLTNIGLGGEAMAASALVPGASRVLNPYIKGTIGSVPYVQNAAANVQGGRPLASQVPQIFGNTLSDASNVASVLPVGEAARGVTAGQRFIPGVVNGFKNAAISNVPWAVAGGTGQALADPNNTTPGQVLKSAALNSLGNEALGTALGGVVHGTGLAVPHIANGIESITPKLNSVVQHYSDLVGGALRNERGSVPLDPLSPGQPRHPAGVSEGGQFRPNEEYIAQPKNKNDLVYNIAKAVEDLSDVNKLHEGVLSRINNNSFATEAQRQQLLSHHADLYEANREAVGERLDNFMRQFEAKYPNGRLPKQLETAMDAELTRVPQAKYQLPDAQTLHEMNASLDNGQPTLTEGQRPISPVQTRQSLHQTIAGNVSNAIEKVKNILNNDRGAIGGSEEPEVSPDQPVINKAEDFINRGKQEDAETQAAIDAQKNAPAPYQLPQVRNIGDVRSNGFAAPEIVKQKTVVTANELDRVVGKSYRNANLFIDAIEHPDEAAEIARKINPKNPQAALDMILKTKETTDLAHSIRSGSGEILPYRQHYFQHLLDLSDPGDAAKYEDMRQGKFKGMAAHERIFNTAREARAAGFKLQKMSIGDMLRTYGRSEMKAARVNALISGVQKLDPRGIADINSEGLPRDAEGKSFIPSGISGMENYALSPKLYRSLQGFRSINVEGMTTPMRTILKSVSALNRGGKQTMLLGGGFHDANTSIRFGGQELLSATLSPTRTADSVAATARMNHAFFSEKAFDQRAEWFNQHGWDDLFAKANLTSFQGVDVRSALDALKGGDLEKFNPYASALFERKIALMKKETMLMEAKRLGITDPARATADQLDKLRGAADDVNNRYGGLNLQVINRNPVVQFAAHMIALAPDFWEGKIRTWANAVGKDAIYNNATGAWFAPDKGTFSKAGMAWRQIMGTAIFVAIATELARKATTGQFSQNLQQGFKNDVLDPNIPLPFTNPKGQKIVAKLPSTDLPEIYRAITDPGHYLSARLSAGLSTLAEAATGKDYYGKPLVDPFKNANPNFVDNVVGAVKSKVPIPVGQFNKYQSGNQNLAESALNVAGLRVARDPNDPAYQQAIAYGKSLTNFQNSLNPNELALFNKINPTKKDADGNQVFTANNLTKPSDYADLLSNPGFTTKYVQWQLSQPNHDPLYDLAANNPQAFTQYLVYQAGKKLLPGQTYDKSGNTLATDLGITGPNGQLAPWYSQLTAARSQWAQSLPQGGTQLASNVTQGPIANPYVQAQMNAGNFKDPQVQAYLNASQGYTNQQRAGLGLSQLPPQGSTPSQWQQGYASAKANYQASKDRTRLKNDMKYAFKDAKYNVKQSQKKTGKFTHAYHETQTKGYLAKALTTHRNTA